MLCFIDNDHDGAKATEAMSGAGRSIPGATCTAPPRPWPSWRCGWPARRQPMPQGDRPRCIPRWEEGVPAVHTIYVRSATVDHSVLIVLLLLLLQVLSVLAPGPGSCRGEGQEGEGGAGRLSDWPWYHQPMIHPCIMNAVDALTEPSASY
jgi:hypothetical protein